MPRKTFDGAGTLPLPPPRASMRPRPDAAENTEGRPCPQAAEAALQ